MTCPFYVCDGRPECILGDDRAERHCGPRQYPAGPCNLDEIGRGEAWRSFVSPYCQSWALLCDTPDRLAADMAYVFLVMYASEEFGWSP